MALTSRLVPLGTPAPDFALPDLDGKTVSLGHLAHADVLVVAFLCNHCPYVRHIETKLGRAASSMSAAVVGICSNDVQRYPDDDVAGLESQAERAGWTFPYLVDSDQTVAKAYGAVCTPDFFVYGEDRRLGYRGAFDSSTPGNNHPVTGDALATAVDLLSRGEPVPEPHRPSMGCGIKWRPGMEPA